MHKLTALQTQAIYAIVKNTGILYESILHEMTDHIASALEEDATVNTQNFDGKLQAYANSYKMVTLTTAARQQESLRDRLFLKTFLTRFCTFKYGAMTLLLCTVCYISASNHYANFALSVVYFICLLALIAITFIKKYKAQVSFVARLIQTGGFYLAMILFMISKAHRILGEDSFLAQLLSAVATGLLFTACINMYFTNKYFNRQQQCIN